MLVTSQYSSLSNPKTMKWQILHIPEKPQNSKEQSMTVDVFASQVEPKLANNLVRKLNQVAPLENLRHVKRVRKVVSEDSVIETIGLACTSVGDPCAKTLLGKSLLSVVLCLSFGQANQSEIIPNDVLELINAYKLHPYVTKVAKYAALSKEEWKEQCKLWPTSYHPATYNIDGITGFCEEDSQSIFSYMKVAINLTKSDHHGEKVVNAAVIVDPSIRQVIASACDQTCLQLVPTSKSILESTDCIGRAKIIHSHHSDSNKATSNWPPHSNSTTIGHIRAYDGTSCLHPWRWTEQSPCGQSQTTLVKCGSSFSWHPLRHAAIVAIEYAAARDRKLFPNLEPSKSQSSQIDDHLQSSSLSLLAKRRKTELSSNDNVESDPSTNGLPSELTQPYLCTGFDIYLVWEPCTMCAMALVHQRIRRIFYAFPNPNAGALGSVHRLQGERSLNHHYAVFRVLLPEEGEEETSTDSKP